MFSGPSFIGLNKCFLNETQMNKPKTQELCRPRPSQVCWHGELKHLLPMQTPPYQCGTCAPGTQPRVASGGCGGLL